MFGAFYLGSGYYGVGPIGILKMVFTNPDIDGTLAPDYTATGNITPINLPEDGTYTKGYTGDIKLEQQSIEDPGKYTPGYIKNGRY